VTVPGYHAGRPPRNKGRRYPADPPTVEEIIAVMRTAGAGADGVRLRALIVLLWRAGLRIGEALALAETDLDRRRGAVLIRHGKSDKRREVGMDSWAWEQLEPWQQLRVRFPVGPLLCVIHGRIWSNGAARRSSCRPVSLLARCGTTLTAGCQFRFRLEARMCLGRGLAPAARSGDQRSTATGAAWRSRMIAPSRPDGRSPGPIGPDRFSPTGGNFRRAALAATDMWLSCHSISSRTTSGRSGVASPAALAAYAAAPRACAAMAGRQPLARLLGRRRPHSDRSPRVRRHRRRSGGGSLLRRQVRRGRRPAFGRLNRGDGCHVELRPRTGPALAPRNPPPTQRRFVAQLRSAFAENPHPSCSQASPNPGARCPVGHLLPRMKRGTLGMAVSGSAPRGNSASELAGESDRRRGGVTGLAIGLQCFAAANGELV